MITLLVLGSGIFIGSRFKTEVDFAGKYIKAKFKAAK